MPRHMQRSAILYTAAMYLDCGIPPRDPKSTLCALSQTRVPSIVGHVFTPQAYHCIASQTPYRQTLKLMLMLRLS